LLDSRVPAAPSNFSVQAGLQVVPLDGGAATDAEVSGAAVPGDESPVHAARSSVIRAQPPTNPRRVVLRADTQPVIDAPFGT
jgi:hypothetical protein